MWLTHLILFSLSCYLSFWNTESNTPSISSLIWLLNIVNSFCSETTHILKTQNLAEDQCGQSNTFYKKLLLYKIIYFSIRQFTLDERFYLAIVLCRLRCYSSLLYYKHLLEMRLLPLCFHSARYLHCIPTRKGWEGTDVPATFLQLWSVDVQWPYMPSSKWWLTVCDCHMEWNTLPGP